MKWREQGRIDRLGTMLWWWLGMAPAVVAMAAPRGDWDGPSLAQAIGLPLGDPEALASMCNLSLNLGLLAIAVPLVIVGMMRANWRELAVGPMALAAAALAMALALLINPMTSVPSGSVLWPAVSLALVFGGAAVTRDITGRLRAICLVLVWGSLLVALLIPAWAVQPGYDIGIIPGFEIRLYGLSGHANQLAVAAFLAFVLLLHDPSAPRRRLHIAACLAVLLLVQSKTFFLLVPIALAVRWGFALLPAKRPQALGFAVAGMTGLLILGAMVLDAHSSTEVSEVALGEDTYHARTVIWDITLREWAQRPLFGYGPTLWDHEMGMRHLDEMGWLVRGHAHNQYVQVLGHSGIIGLVCFVAFLVWLIARGVRLAWRGDGRELSLIAVILVRSMVEPFMHAQILDVGALFMLGTMVLLAGPTGPEVDALPGPDATLANHA